MCIHCSPITVLLSTLFRPVFHFSGAIFTHFEETGRSIGRTGNKRAGELSRKPEAVALYGYCTFRPSVKHCYTKRTTFQSEISNWKKERAGECHAIRPPLPYTIVIFILFLPIKDCHTKRSNRRDRSALETNARAHELIKTHPSL